jgi:hypothetical protein
VGALHHAFELLDMIATPGWHANPPDRAILLQHRDKSPHCTPLVNLIPDLRTFWTDFGQFSPVNFLLATAQHTCTRSASAAMIATRSVTGVIVERHPIPGQSRRLQADSVDDYLR